MMSKRHDGYEDTEQYYADRDARWAAEDADERAYLQTDSGRLERMEHRLALLTPSVAWGSGEARNEIEIATLRTAIAELKARIEADEDARFAAEWTREVTMARRAEWNRRARAGEFSVRGKVHWATVRTIERTVLGWRNEDLQRAIKLHGL